MHIHPRKNNAQLICGIISWEGISKKKSVLNLIDQKKYSKENEGKQNSSNPLPPPTS